METVENQNGKPPATNMFATWENVSLKTQQSIVAIAAAVASSLAVVTVLQVDINRGSPIGFQLMAVLGTAIAVSATSFTLQQITINRINRSRKYLQKLVDNWWQPDESELEFGREWEELSLSFYRMKEAIAARIGDLQQQAETAAKEKEELQQQFIEFVNSRELNSSGEIETAGNDGGRSLNPPGTILEFIEQLTTREHELDLDLFIGSSTPAEIQQRQNLLEYRELWLQAILAETKKELDFISRINQRANNQPIDR